MKITRRNFLAKAAGALAIPLLDQEAFIGYQQTAPKLSAMQVALSIFNQILWNDKTAFEWGPSEQLIISNLPVGQTIRLKTFDPQYTRSYVIKPGTLIILFKDQWTDLFYNPIQVRYNAKDLAMRFIPNAILGEHTHFQWDHKGDMAIHIIGLPKQTIEFCDNPQPGSCPRIFRIDAEDTFVISLHYYWRETDNNGL